MRVSQPEATIGHATIHGTPGGSPPISADVDGLVAAVLVAPGKLALGLPRATITVRGLPGGGVAKGAVIARYEQPSASAGERSADVSWRGSVGGIAESLRATLDGGAVAALVDVPAASPEQVLALWPASPLRAPAAAHVEARGTLPNLYVVARVGAGTGALSVSGPVAVDHSPRASLHLDATAIDVTAFAPGPATTLGATGDALLAVGKDGTFGGAIALDVPGSHIAGVETPGLSLVAEARKEAAGTSAHATLLVREPGAPTTLDLHLTPKGRSFALAFDASTPRATLAAIRGVRKVARGTAASGRSRNPRSGHAGRGCQGRRVGERRRRSERSTSGRRACARGSAGSLHALPRSMPKPTRPISPWATTTLGSLDVKAHGSPTRSSIEVALVGKEGRLDGTTTLDLTDGTALRNTTVDLVGRGEHMTATASLVGITPAGTHADDIVVTGLGAPLRGSVSTSPGALAIRARTERTRARPACARRRDRPPDRGARRGRRRRGHPVERRPGTPRARPGGREDGRVGRGEGARRGHAPGGGA